MFGELESLSKKEKQARALVSPIPSIAESK